MHGLSTKSQYFDYIVDRARITCQQLLSSSITGFQAVLQRNWKVLVRAGALLSIIVANSEADVRLVETAWRTRTVLYFDPAARAML